MGLALSLANVFIFSYCGINLPLHEAYLCSLCNVQYLDIDSVIEKKNWCHKKYLDFTEPVKLILCRF